MGIGGSRQNCESSGVRVPVRLIACSRPIAYPMRAKATTHVLLGCKRLSCPVGKLTAVRSEEHTSELQSRVDLVCRLLLEKKKKKKNNNTRTPRVRKIHTGDAVH